MPADFRATRKGISGALTEEERSLVRKFIVDLLMILDTEEGQDTSDSLEALVGLDIQAHRPTDPALLRLLPDGVAGDEQGAAEFRKYTERSLRQLKVANLKALDYLISSSQSADGLLQLSEEHALIFIKALTDIRLVLAVRMGITTDEDTERLPNIFSMDEVESVDDYMALVYHYLTALQESLVQAVMDFAPFSNEHPDGTYP